MYKIPPEKCLGARLSLSAQFRTWQEVGHSQTEGKLQQKGKEAPLDAPMFQGIKKAQFCARTRLSVSGESQVNRCWKNQSTAPFKSDNL